MFETDHGQSAKVHGQFRKYLCSKQRRKQRQNRDENRDKNRDFFLDVPQSKSYNEDRMPRKRKSPTERARCRAAVQQKYRQSAKGKQAEQRANKTYRDKMKIKRADKAAGRRILDDGTIQAI